MSETPATELIDCHVCVLGAGIAGLNALFAASRHVSASDKLVIVDRREAPAGMWNSTYRYVRLHCFAKPSRRAALDPRFGYSYVRHEETSGQWPVTVYCRRDFVRELPSRKVRALIGEEQCSATVLATSRPRQWH